MWPWHWDMQNGIGAAENGDIADVAGRRHGARRSTPPSDLWSNSTILFCIVLLSSQMLSNGLPLMGSTPSRQTPLFHAPERQTDIPWGPGEPACRMYRPALGRKHGYLVLQAVAVGHKIQPDAFVLSLILLIPLMLSNGWRMAHQSQIHPRSPRSVLPFARSVCSYQVFPVHTLPV